ncbi:MAG: polyprenyl synthetase family protein [Actinomycetota bacterium]|nr:polyprenyl synthetase family protein [Actinomycetota bacterium]
MIEQTKRRIDLEISSFIEYIDEKYDLKNLSPLMFESIREYLLREGKRVRPLLFIFAHMGYSTRQDEPKNLFRAAISTELLHDFLLVHDDIVDRSDTRRGLPSMHKMLGKEIEGHPFVSFSGEDLAIIIGDVIYSMALEAFLSVEEEPERKEAAFLKFIESAFYTGCGEFIEILTGSKKLLEISKELIYKIYDYKTAHYTFVSPLLAGAMLAGAQGEDLAHLKQFGISLGRAFQINDDILGVFGDEKSTGKSSLTDLTEKKKTLLLWHAYENAGAEAKRDIQHILSKDLVTKTDLDKARKIMTEAGSLGYAKSEILALSERAAFSLKSTTMKDEYKAEIATLMKMILGA